MTISKKIIITEAQYNKICQHELQLNESLIMEAASFTELLERCKQLLKRGFTAAAILSMVYTTLDLSTNEQNLLKYELQRFEERFGNERLNSVVSIDGPVDHNKWQLVSNKTTATVYNPVKSQCNSDIEHTAHMFRLNLSNVEPQRVVAMERTMMKDCGIKYGDVIYIEGAGDCDGVYRVEDTMNKRFAGQHKVDILKQNRKLGKWDNVNIYALKDKADTSLYTSQMEPSFKGQQQIAQNIKENIG